MHFPPERLHCRLDNLLSIREKTAAADRRAAEGAEEALSGQLRPRREELAGRVEELRARLEEVGEEASQARGAHARAVKARREAIAKLQQHMPFSGAGRYTPR